MVSTTPGSGPPARSHQFYADPAGRHSSIPDYLRSSAGTDATPLQEDHAPVSQNVATARSRLDAFLDECATCPPRPSWHGTLVVADIAARNRGETDAASSEISNSEPQIILNFRRVVDAWMQKYGGFFRKACREVESSIGTTDEIITAQTLLKILSAIARGDNLNSLQYSWVLEEIGDIDNGHPHYLYTTFRYLALYVQSASLKSNMWEGVQAYKAIHHNWPHAKEAAQYRTHS